MAMAILVHVVLIGVLVISFQWTSAPAPSQPKVDIIKAVAVDEKKIQAEVNKLKRAEARKKQRARDVERRRKREEQRLAKLRREQAAEKKRQKKLKEQLAKERAEKQKEVERLKTERLAEEKRLADAQAKQKRLEEQKRQQAEAAARQREIAAQEAALERERQKRLSGLRGQYIANIQNKVERNWIKPASARAGLSCQVDVKQIPGGEVINVTVTRCTGDEFFRRSVEAAVYKASPLPVPSDPALFDREIVFTFAPKK